MKKSTLIHILALFAAVSLTGCGDKESVETYLEQARLSQQNSKLGESIIALKNAIKLNPRNAEVRFLLGNIYLSQGNAVNAVKELEKAKEYRYNSDTLLPLLVRAYYLNNQDEEIIELASSIKDLSVDTRNQYWFYHTLAQISLENLAQAKLAVDKANAIDGSSGYSLLSLAHLTFFEQEVEKAIALTKQALAALPNQPEAILLLGNLAGVMEDYPTASENYRQYLALQPQQRSAELLLANSLLREGKLQEAEQYADSIIKVLPNQPFANYVKAMVRIQEKDYAAASEHAETAIRNNYNQANIKLVAGTSAFYLKNYEQVLQHLEPLLPYLPDDHFARRMIVVSQLELGIIENVAETVGESSDQYQKDSEFYSLLGFKLLQAGASDEAKALLEKAPQAGTDAESQMRDGVLKLMLNDDSAVKSLEKALELNPDLAKAELALAYVAINQHDYDKAMSIAEKWQTTYPDKPDGLNLKSAIALKQKNLALAKQLLNQALDVDANNVYTLQQLTRIALFEKEQQKAAQYADKLLTIAPKNPQVLRQYFVVHNNTQALDMLKKLVSENKENNDIALVYAEALLKSNQLDDGMTILSNITPDRKTPKLYWQLKMAGYRQQNKINLAQATLEEWRKLNPYHIEPIVYLADLYTLKQDHDAALNVVNSGLAQHKNNTSLKLVKLQLLFNTKNVDGAKKLYADMEQSLDNASMKQGIEGRIALLEKNFSVAQQKLIPYYQSQPSHRNASLLAAAFIGGENRVKAIELLVNHQEKQGFNSKISSLLGSLQLEEDKQENALNTYQEMVKQQPKNIVALNNVAWLSMEQGDFEGALAYAEQAIELAPKVANVVDTYAQILLKMGNARAALREGKKAYELSKGNNVDITLNYAEALLTNKRTNEAKKLLLQLKNITAKQTEKKQRLINLL